MKKIFLIWFLLMGFSVLTEAHSRDSDRRNDGQYDRKALRICKSLSGLSGYWESECKNAIRGKEYTKREVRNCESFEWYHNVIDCFEHSGVRRRGRERSNLKGELHRMAHKALGTFNRGLYNKTARILRRMRENIEFSQKFMFKHNMRRMINNALRAYRNDQIRRMGRILVRIDRKVHFY